MAGCPCQVTTLTAPVGAAGPQGEYGGNSLDWNFSTGGVSNGDLRLDTATLSAVTQINVNEVDPNGTNVADWLNAIAVNDRVKIFVEADNTTFGVYTVDVVATVAGERVLTVTEVDSNGSLTNGTSVVLTHALRGPAGAAGSNGTNGTTIIEVDFSGQSTSNTGGFAQLTTDALPSGAWAATDDTIEIEAMLLTNITTAGRFADIKIQLTDGVNTQVLLDTTTVNDTRFKLFKGEEGVRLIYRVTRTNTTEVRDALHSFKMTGITYASNEGALQLGYDRISTALTPLTLSGVVNVEVLGQVDNGADEIKLSYLKIKQLLT